MKRPKKVKRRYTSCVNKRKLGVSILILLLMGGIIAVALLFTVFKPNKTEEGTIAEEGTNPYAVDGLPEIHSNHILATLLNLRTSNLTAGDKEMVCADYVTGGSICPSASNPWIEKISLEAGIVGEQQFRVTLTDKND